MINRHPLPWLTKAAGPHVTRSLTDRLEKLAADYHLLFQHSDGQQAICPACRALDPAVTTNPPQQRGVDR